MEWNGMEWGKYSRVNWKVIEGYLISLLPENEVVQQPEVVFYPVFLDQHHEPFDAIL